MPPEKFHRIPDDDVEQQAAAWFTRCDRGLTPAEQDEYLQWLQADARHGAAYARQEETLQRLEQLREWQPIQSTEPNPDLFAPPRSRSWKWMSLATSVAAVLVIVAALLIPTGLHMASVYDHDGLAACVNSHSRGCQCFYEPVLLEIYP